MKIVINNCYGGFGLSDMAVQRLKEIKNISDLNFYHIKRHDNDLVQVVEELGVESNGLYSHLKIQEIPDGLIYDLTEYDGLEDISIYVPTTIEELKNGLSEDKLELLKTHKNIRVVFSDKLENMENNNTKKCGCGSNEYCKCEPTN